MPLSGRLSDLFGRRRFDIKPGISRITSLLSRIGNPEREFRSIHVVGTNGKGSTSAFLASMLTTAGYRTGLFTSPHLVNYRERFRLDGTEVDDPVLDSIVSSILQSASEEDTFFELTTAVACRYFADSGADIAVLEAGMGGRSDATAAVEALATVITPVSIDHTAWLGSTLKEIAFEKVSIAEPGTMVISSLQPSESLDVIEAACRSKRSPLLLADRDFFASPEAGSSVSFRSGKTVLENITLGIPGSYQIWNAATAIAACKALEPAGFRVSDADLKKGLSSAAWPGRMQRYYLNDGQKLLLDGAHNMAGAEALCESVSKEHNPEKTVMVTGLMQDKDVSGISSVLKRLANRIITVAPAQERAESPAVLAGYFAGEHREVRVAGSVADGINLARAISGSGEIILVTGSLFVVGEALAMLSGVDCQAVRG